MINTQILVIYPQDNSTKVAIYQNMNLLFFNNIIHKKEDLQTIDALCPQCELRKKDILTNLKENDVDINSIGIIIARGGLTKPLKSGVYKINQKLKDDLQQGIMGKHAINLGAWLADEFAAMIPNAQAFIADSVVVDELDEIARYTGHPLFKRRSVFHASNHKHIARKYAQSVSKTYENLNLIVAHIGGGGVSIGAHKKGRVIDVNQAFDGEGPFALTRTGTIPAGDLVRLCFSGQYTQEEIVKLITHKGGILAYLGTTNMYEIEKKLQQGNQEANHVMNAFAYQIAKEIGSMYTVLNGEVDAIILIGEYFQIRSFTDYLTAKINKIAKIVVFPIVNDMDSLASNGLMILKGEINIWEYE